jgi:hypothetical protein
MATQGNGTETPTEAPSGRRLDAVGKTDGSSGGRRRENPRDLWLAGNRSSQPPSAPRALVPQATSASFARLPDRRRWLALRLPSAFAGSGSPRGVPSPTDPRLTRLAAFPAGPPGPASRPSPVSGPPSDPRGSSWVPRVRIILRCPGRSSGPLASITSTAWSEAKDTGGTEGGQLHISAGQGTNAQVDAVGQRVTNR